MMMKGALNVGRSSFCLIDHRETGSFAWALGYAEGRHDNDVLLWSPTGWASAGYDLWRDFYREPCPAKNIAF